MSSLKAYYSDIFNSGEKLNGVALAKASKFTQSNTSTHLKTLVKKGYITRRGYDWRPVRDHRGLELPVIKTVLPPAPARGYKPMTQKLGDIARIRS